MIETNPALVILPIILYILGSILLVVLIILGIKLIITMNKIEKVVDDVNIKVKKQNKLFKIIDKVTDKIATITENDIEGISTVVKKIFGKGKGE